MQLTQSLRGVRVGLLAASVVLLLATPPFVMGMLLARDIIPGSGWGLLVTAAAIALGVACAVTLFVGVDKWFWRQRRANANAIAASHNISPEAAYELALKHYDGELAKDGAVWGPVYGKVKTKKRFHTEYAVFSLSYSSSGGYKVTT